MPIQARRAVTLTKFLRALASVTVFFSLASEAGSALSQIVLSGAGFFVFLSRMD